MRSLRLALAQMNPSVGDLRGNGVAIRRWLARAEAAGADLAAFPELALTGYPPEDLLLKPAFVDENLRAVQRLAKDVGDTAAIVGFVDRTDAGLHNAAAVLWRGRIRGIYHKVLLPNYGVFDEKRYFVPGSDYPVFGIRGVQVGVSICEDAWDSDGPVRALARAGAEVVVNINASPYHRGKGLERRILFRQRAIESRAWFAYLQTVGGQDELVFDGESLVYDPAGTLIATGKQFEEDLVILDIAPRRAPRRSSKLVLLSKEPSTRQKKPAVAAPGVAPPMPEDDEVYAALVLGVRDYLRKNGFARAIVGLSGGIDSALTAVIAADAIGAQNVLGVAMPSAISSNESFEDAKALATNLGIEFRVVPIAEIFEAFMSALSEAFAGRPRDDTEDNLQARNRGTILMSLSNKTGAIVLTTGNKSEMATGYSTLYGDLAGGFAVIKDVPKTLVYRIARRRNERGPTVIPERIFTKPPTAELHPGQLDTDALPPYDVLDPILEAYVERDEPIPKIVKRGFDEAVVRRVARMVDLSEYKRRQTPPGIKITPRAFGRDRRLPISNQFRAWADDPPAVKNAKNGKRGSR